MKSRYLFYSSLLLFCPASLNSCNNDSEEVVCGSNPCQPCNFSEEVAALYDQLNEMYEDNCVSCLEDFLETWHAKYPPREEIPDSNRLLYEIYRDVYTPWDLGAFTYMDTMKHPYYTPDLNQGVKYYIIRDYKIDKNEFLRPVVSAENVKVLYLRPEYELSLSCFLDHYDRSAPGPLKLNRSELDNREKFLENYFQVAKRWFLVDALNQDQMSSYVFSYYYLETQPYIGGFIFSSDSIAKTRIHIGPIEWDVIITKKDDEWLPIEIKLSDEGLL